MQKEDRVQVSIHINGKQGINELGKLEMEANELRFAMKKMKKGSDEFVASSQKYNQVKQRISQVRDKLGIAGMTMQQLRRYQRDLSREMDTGVTRGTKRYQELNAKIVQVNRQIQRQRMEMRGANSLWSRLGKEVKQFGALALGYLGITTLTAQIGNLIGRSGDFSDALGQVSKTTGLTADEVEDLNSKLKVLDTRTARKELLSMAKIAGKLGITAKNDILGFVSAADKINVALGEDLGDPEQSMRKLGKLIESFKVKEVYGIEEAMLKVGSSINHLGKSSTANEGYIVEFTRRMGGIAPLAKITIQDILGLAAASDALGLTQEVTTTALSKLFIKMTSNRDVFAGFTKDVHGNQLSLEDFSNLIDNDFNQAFLALLRGVKDNSQGMIQLSETLSDLELDGGRVVQVLGTLSNNTKLIGEQQKISNDEFEKGTSVLNEYNLMNETLGAKLDKIRKALFAAFVNGKVVGAIESMVGWIDKLIKKPLSEQMEKDRISLMTMGLELKSTNTSLERRNQIITELQSQFPGYFENLSAENIEYSKLNDSLNKVNQALIDKIVIQQRDEEIGEKAAAAAEKKNELLETEARLRENLVRAAQKYGKELPEGDNIIDQFERLKSSFLVNAPGEFTSTGRSRGILASGVLTYKRQLEELDELNDELSEIQKDRNELFNKLFPNGDPLRSKSTPTETEVSNKSVLPISTEAKKEKEDPLKAYEEDLQKEINALKQARADQLLTEEEYLTELQALELAHLLVLKEARESFGLDTLDIEEQILDKKIKILDEIEKAESDRAEKKRKDLEEEKKLEEQMIELKERQIELAVDAAFQAIEAAKSFEEAGKNILNAIRNQIRAHIAEGISVAMKKALVGVPFPFNIAAAGAAAGAAAALFDTLVPSFYDGGDTGSRGIGFGDSKGEFTGFTHKNEFVVSEKRLKRGPQVVIPSYQTGPSKVVDLNAINTTANQGMSLTSPNSTGDVQTAQRMEMAAERQEKATAEFAEWVGVLKNIKLKAEFGNRAYEDATEEFERAQTNRKKGFLR